LNSTDSQSHLEGLSEIKKELSDLTTKVTCLEVRQAELEKLVAKLTSEQPRPYLKKPPEGFETQSQKHHLLDKHLKLKKPEDD